MEKVCIENQKKKKKAPGKHDWKPGRGVILLQMQLSNQRKNACLLFIQVEATRIHGGIGSETR